MTKIRKERREIKEKACNILLEGWMELANTESYEILSMIFKSIQQISAKTNDCFYKKFEDLWAVIERCLSSILSQKEDHKSLLRPLLGKLISSIIDTFKCLFCYENAKEFEIVQSEKMQANLYNVLQKVYYFVKLFYRLYLRVESWKVIEGLLSNNH